MGVCVCVCVNLLLTLTSRAVGHGASADRAAVSLLCTCLPRPAVCHSLRSLTIRQHNYTLISNEMQSIKQKKIQAWWYGYSDVSKVVFARPGRRLDGDNA